jgi:hypothetical protein
MVDQTLLDLDRKDLNFTSSKVKSVLPEHYTTDYPILVKFLEYYYDFMNSNASHGFDNTIQNLYGIRDLRQTDLNNLNQIFKEIGQGLVSSDFFTDPRQTAGLLANSYRIKGSLYSAEGFFRAFYGEQPEVVYPKNNLFLVGESKIGAESLRYIQNGALYQVLSVLIRSGTPIAKWRDLYKAFVHPSGFYLGGEVIIESVGNLDLNFMPLSILDSDAGVFSFEQFAAMDLTGFASLTGIYPDGGDSDTSAERIDLNATVKAYSEITVSQLEAMYDNIEDAISANNAAFDDSDGIKFSNTIETMDGVKYDNFNPPRYVEADSA